MTLKPPDGAVDTLLTERALLDRIEAREPFLVQDYYPLCGNGDGTDDAIAISAVAVLARAAEGRVILGIPSSGAYNVASPIRADVPLEGQSGFTRINALPALASNARKMILDITTRTFFTAIRRLELNCNFLTGVQAISTADNVQGVGPSIYEDLHIIQSAPGVYAVGPATPALVAGLGMFAGAIFIRIEFDNCAQWLQLYGNGGDDVQFIGLRGAMQPGNQPSTGPPIQIIGSVNVTFDSSYFGLSNSGYSTGGVKPFIQIGHQPVQFQGAFFEAYNAAATVNLTHLIHLVGPGAAFGWSQGFLNASQNTMPNLVALMRGNLESTSQTYQHATVNRVRLQTPSGHTPLSIPVLDVYYGAAASTKKYDFAFDGVDDWSAPVSFDATSVVEVASPIHLRGWHQARLYADVVDTNKGASRPRPIRPEPRYNRALSRVETMDPFGDSQTLVSGTIYGCIAEVEENNTFSNIRFMTGDVAPVALTAVRACVYTSAGVLSSVTADIKAALTGANVLVTQPLGTPLVLVEKQKIVLALAWTGTTLSISGRSAMATALNAVLSTNDGLSWGMSATGYGGGATPGALSVGGNRILPYMGLTI